MRGGDPNVIEIPIADTLGRVNHTTPAVTLHFSDKPKLFISIDLNKYKGDVRTLLHHLFNIDGFNRNTTHNIDKFLLGLADHTARIKNVETVQNYVKKCNKDTQNKINDKNTIFEDTDTYKKQKCDLEIELTEKKGDIIFEVKKYHRIKFGTIDCMVGNLVDECEFDDEDYSVIPDSCRSVYKGEKKEGDCYYPILEFADANPFFGFGIDYIDYRSSTHRNQIFKKRQSNISKFTVKNKTIAELKGMLPKIIVLDKDGEPSTIELEDAKREEEKKAKKKNEEMKFQQQKDEEARKKAEIDKANTDFNTMFGNFNGEEGANFESLKKAMEDVKDFTKFVLDWKRENTSNGYSSEVYEQVLQKHEELNTAVQNSYTKLNEIVDSLQLLLKNKEHYVDGPKKDRYGKIIKSEGGNVLENYYTLVLKGERWDIYRKYLIRNIAQGDELTELWGFFLPSTW